MRWRQVTVRCTDAQAPLVAEALEGQGASAVSFVDSEDIAVLEPPPGEAVLWAHTTVSGLFDTPEPDADLRTRVLGAIDLGNTAEVSVASLEQRDWVRETQASFAPRSFGHGLWVLPHGTARPETAQAAIWLDPGIAFGTGSHPTTSLCLEWLARETLGRSGDQSLGTVLDYGCGSGILSLAALRLGASAAVMIDIDAQALDAARENAARNQLGPVAAGLPGALDELLTAPADTVVANILLEPLIELAPLLLAKARPGARVCLSGILAPQLDRLGECYGGWLSELEHHCADGWARLSGIRTQRTAPNQIA